MQSNKSVHPGQYIKDLILIPKKLSVTFTAKLIGVSRPALSNFLNGHVRVTEEMAARIEVAFSVPKKDLLNMQLSYDLSRHNTDKAISDVVRYTPILWKIKAKDIEDWSERIESRNQLAVLLRILIHSTGYISSIDFPGNDNAQKSGWDGYLTSRRTTPWIPIGDSGWELSVAKNIQQKANKDFEARSRVSHKNSQLETFVFVTTRNWPGKKKWIDNCISKGLWKAVRAYDASDLEQWIEQSLSAQIWFAEQIEKPISGLRTLDKCWQNWSHITEPPLVGTFFKSAINKHKESFCNFLSTVPPQPITMKADSYEEALAFLSQLFGDLGGEELKKYRGKVLVMDNKEVLPKISQCAGDFIIVCNARIAHELGELVTKTHTIFLYPRNMANIKANIILDQPDNRIFEASLCEMGYQLSDVLSHVKKSGQSLTVLRRQLANIPMTFNPSWASDKQKKLALVPFLFAGAWDSDNKTDQKRLGELTDKPFEELEKQFCVLADQDDSPLWTSGFNKGVVSAVDLLHIVSGYITTADLERYFKVASDVLQEKDPMIDISEEKRFAALSKSTAKKHSALLRNGITKMLPLLALYGEELLENRLGTNYKKIDPLINNLLSPLTLEKLKKHEEELPIYAEAAPNSFLDILEKDLESSNSACSELMNSTTQGLFRQCYRVSLLWALESLAWNKHTLLRSTLILAKLATIKISDNWNNTPINSLKAIFSVWMPQTSIDQEERLKVLDSILKKFPEVAWEICLNQVDLRGQTASYSHKQKWRSDGLGSGEPIRDRKEIVGARKPIIKMILNWPGKDGYSKTMLDDLITYFDSFAPDEKEEIWDLINQWLEQNPSDADKAFISDKIRINIELSTLSNIAKTVQKKLLEIELLHKYEWLFKDYVEQSAGKKTREVDGFHKHQQFLDKARIKALEEIFMKYGNEGIFKFTKMEISIWQLGASIAKTISVELDILNFLLESWTAILNSQTNSDLIKGMLSVICSNKNDKSNTDILQKIKQKLNDSDFAKFLLLAPFQSSVCHLVDQLEERAQKSYWQDVAVGISIESNNTEVVNYLRNANRPSAAFEYIVLNFGSISGDLLFQLMCEMRNTIEQLEGKLSIHSIVNAVGIINQSSLLTLEQKAEIEFSYIEALNNLSQASSISEIPNLEIYIELHPEFFVQCIVRLYKLKDNEEDLPESKVQQESCQHLAKTSYSVLRKLSRIPGCNESTQEKMIEKLQNWIHSVRDTSRELSRLDVADCSIGELLSKAPIGEDGVWPCESVRKVLEDFNSDAMMEGTYIGRYNTRGMIEMTGGKQELELAKQYRKWGDSIMFEYPSVKSKLLDVLAEIYEQEAKYHKQWDVLKVKT